MKIWEATGEASVESMLSVLDQMKEAGAMRKKVKEALAEEERRVKTGGQEQRDQGSKKRKKK